MQRLLAVVLAGLLASASPSARAGYEKTFLEGSLIIPMDLAYQDHGLLQAYGLVFQLLRQGVRVYWVIDPDKTWHAAACDTVGDECDWDCVDEGSNEKCPYPTASPDLYAAGTVVWDDQGLASAGDPVPLHGYRGGPFVIDAIDRDRALALVDAWNDADTWAQSPWAERTVFHVVTVHETTEAVTGWVRKEMLAAPTIAVFSDGNENIATGYLRAAGIPQSTGVEFPAAKCTAGQCGPGTPNPDMLTVESVMGDMGTCDAPVNDHQNGALFTADGIPAYCQIMSMHWDVNDRETVRCDDGACPATAAECTGQRFTYHGHEVVAEVRAFLRYPTHFFAECQAVNAYENTVPDPAWPFLDDAGRDGHFLTTTGSPPDCPCTEAGFTCVIGGCDGGARDCCQPQNVKEKGAGFLIAAQPASATLQILHPEVPYNQLDGAFATVGGSEPAYNLSAYLGTEYQNDMDVTFITGPDGPGDQDVWMTGFIDGQCWIGSDDVQPGQCTMGKVSYLGGHAYKTAVPVSTNADTQGTRLFLNALFEADCVASAGQPNLQVRWQGPEVLAVTGLPARAIYTAMYFNTASGTALDAVLTAALPEGADATGFEAGGVEDGTAIAWTLGSVGGVGGQPGDPPANGSRWVGVQLDTFGVHTLRVDLGYRVGVTDLSTPPATLTVRVVSDRDGDGVPDDADPAPDDPDACGDSDGDHCDDCSQGAGFDPAHDGPDADGDGICDASTIDPGDGDGGKGCGCRTSGGDAWPVLVVMLGLGFLVGRSRRRRSR
jgi:MYXO-CTERM domain-containing protein